MLRNKNFTGVDEPGNQQSMTTAETSTPESKALSFSRGTVVQSVERPSKVAVVGSKTGAAV